MAPIDPSDLERLKYQLEREKFQWQKASHQNENAIFNRHFGVIITAVVSAAAIVVSLTQLSITSENSKTQIESEKSRNDRLFYLEAGRFLLTYEKELRTEDVDKVTYFRDIIVASFPPHIAVEVCITMRNTSRTPATRKLWQDALNLLGRRNPHLAARIR